MSVFFLIVISSPEMNTLSLHDALPIFAPLKPEPRIVTLVPTGPLVGEKLLIPDKMVKRWEEQTSELELRVEVVSMLVLEITVRGTVALIEVAETTVKLVALVPLNLTAV